MRVSVGWSRPAQSCSVAELDHVAVRVDDVVSGTAVDPKREICNGATGVLDLSQRVRERRHLEHRLQRRA